MRLRRLVVGAAAALAVVSTTGWRCDYSQSCNGWGNHPKDCAAELLGGDPINVPGGRGMSRGGLPNPTSHQREACRDAARIIYGDDATPLALAIEGCNLLVHWHTRRCPTWSHETHKFVKYC